MAKLGTITLKGLSGTEYKFNVYKWDTDFDDIGAVYYISNRHKDDDGGWKHTKIYIGQTGDLSDHFDNHHKSECFEDHDVNAVSVHRDDDEDSRLVKEIDLIMVLNPPCNG